MSETIDAARQLLAKRLSELDEERRKLEAALHNLGKSSSRPQKRGKSQGGRPASGGKAKKRPGAKRAKRGQRRQQFLDALSSGPLKGSEIAKKIGVSPNQVYGLARQLQDDGLVTKQKDRYRLKKGK